MASKKDGVRKPIVGIFVLCCCLASPGCKHPEPTGYKAISYDRSQHQWTVIKSELSNGHVLQTRMILRCKHTMFGGRGWNDDPDSCSLPIGKLIVPNLSPAKGHESERVVVDESGDQEIRIYQGSDDDVFGQSFEIKQQTSLSDH